MSHKHSDDNVRLGRTTVWEEVDGQVIPFGQKIFLADDEEIPLLDIRKIEFEERPEAESIAAEQGASG
jgi:protein involved in temperature-dependent protein secretion